MNSLKKMIKNLIPTKFKKKITPFILSIYKINTLMLDNINPITELIDIPDNYYICHITWEDKDKLEKFYAFKSDSTFKRKAIKRLNSSKIVGIAVKEFKSGDIVYMSWMIKNFKDYLTEYSVNVESPNIFWESADCLPEHRHKGLHSRVQQEVVNFCAENQIKYLIIQIEDSNVKGLNYNLSFGFKLISKKYSITWIAFDIYRNLFSFIKNPFKKIIY